MAPFLEVPRYGRKLTVAKSSPSTADWATGSSSEVRGVCKRRGLRQPTEKHLVRAVPVRSLRPCAANIVRSRYPIERRKRPSLAQPFGQHHEVEEAVI